MTFPVRGYPDWQRRSSVADQVLLYYTGRVAVANDQFGPFYVGNVPQLFVRMRATVGNVLMQLQFYADQALTQLVSAFTVESRALVQFSQTVSVQAPWLKVVVAEAVGGNMTYDAAVTCASSPGYQMTGPSDATLISAIDTAIGAASGVNVYSARAAYGRATWTAYCNTGNWNAYMGYRDIFGTIIYVDFISGVMGPTTRNIFIGAGQTTIRVFNFGAAGLFEAFLSVDPLAGG